MGGAIYGLDMMLRPQFAVNGMMELVLFLIEGAACDVVYTMSQRGSRGFGSFASSFENLSLVKSLLAGGTIWLTDMFLRVDSFGGESTEIVKFIIQGFIVYVALGMDLSTSS